ncbi:hypothetical protein XU18_3251 [Perkinsela sp. CCAP 1560/4]|nr:hypothetical protein XU18_3251 [Perkinsela sp. CCAP 1560/4]|eukprot:KNH05729.1 hypothetical protein XU18_3251 [Perkinsela sp. CCAP 1560/4]
MLKVNLISFFFLSAAAVDSYSAKKIHLDSGDEDILQIESFPTDVRKWEVRDVSRWAQSILEYPFLIPVIEKNRVDGLTLLSLAEADVGAAFRPDNLLVERKISAHIRAIKGCCVCEQSSLPLSDFFQYYQRTKDTTWINYIASLLTPRIALLKMGRDALERFMTRQSLDSVVTYGHETYAQGTDHIQSTWMTTILFYIALVGFPQLYFVYVAMAWAKTNYVIFSVYAISQVMIQFLEYKLILDVQKKVGRERMYTLATWIFPTVIVAISYVFNYILPSVTKDFALYLIMLLQSVHILTAAMSGLGYNMPKHSA